MTVKSSIVTLTQKDSADWHKTFAFLLLSSPSTNASQRYVHSCSLLKGKLNLISVPFCFIHGQQEHKRDLLIINATADVLLVTLSKHNAKPVLTRRA